jgi:hypothetical protein
LCEVGCKRMVDLTEMVLDWDHCLGDLASIWSRTSFSSLQTSPDAYTIAGLQLDDVNELSFDYVEQQHEADQSCASNQAHQA